MLRYISQLVRGLHNEEYSGFDTIHPFDLRINCTLIGLYSMLPYRTGKNTNAGIFAFYNFLIFTCVNLQINVVETQSVSYREKKCAGINGS